MPPPLSPHPWVSQSNAGRMSLIPEARSPSSGAGVTAVQRWHVRSACAAARGGGQCGRGESCAAMACRECLCGSEGRELQCGRGESSAAMACRECARGGGGLGWWKGGVGPALGQGQRLLSDRMQGVPTYVAGRVRGACTGACRPARSARSFKKGEGSPRLMHEPDSWSGLVVRNHA